MVGVCTAIADSTFKVVFTGNAPLGIQLGGSKPVKVLGFQRDRNGLPQAAESDGRIKVGDSLVSVNDVLVKTVNDVAAQLNKRGLSERAVVLSASDGRTVAESAGAAENKAQKLTTLFVLGSGQNRPHKLVGLAAEHTSALLPLYPLRIVAAEPRHACGEVQNEALLRNAVVVVERGTCSFRDKVIGLQLVGASAVIIINSDNDISAPPVVHDPDGASVTIGVVMVPSSKTKLLLNLAQGTLASPDDKPSYCAFASSSASSSKAKLKEFSVGAREEGESEYAWWSRQFFALFPRKAESQLNEQMRRPVAVDAARVRFRSVHVDGNGGGGGNKAKKSDHSTRYYDALKATFGPRFETCPWGCEPSASSSSDPPQDLSSQTARQLKVLEYHGLTDDYFIASNTSVTGLLVTATPSFGCASGEGHDGDELFFTPPITPVNLALGAAGSGSSSAPWLFVVVWRGGECNFDTKSKQIYAAVTSTLPTDLARSLRVVLLVVNSEAGLFHPEPTVAFHTHPPILVMLLPKAAGNAALTYAEKPAGGPGRLGLVDLSLATPSVGTINDRVEDTGAAASTRSAQVMSMPGREGAHVVPSDTRHASALLNTTSEWVPASDISEAWHAIRVMSSESESMWEQDPKARKKQYISRARDHHPDRGGSQDRFEALLLAYKRASFFLDRDTESGQGESFDDLL
jgi:hypothetical protein